MSSNQVQKEKRKKIAKQINYYLQQNGRDYLDAYFAMDKNYRVEIKVVGNDFKAFLDNENIDEINTIDYADIRGKLITEIRQKNLDYNRKTIQKAIKSNTGVGLNPLCCGYFGLLKYPTRESQRYNAYRELYFESADLEIFLEQNELRTNKEYISINELVELLFPTLASEKTGKEKVSADKAPEKEEEEEEDEDDVLQTTQEFNVIFFGASGTGKSYQLEAHAKNIRVAPENIIRTTFYPEYSNADFVGQYQPTTGYENVLHRITNQHEQSIENEEGYTRPFTYNEFVPGVFTKTMVQALRAKEQNDHQNVLLIIEEINRGNCAAIFGDIFQLLDRIEYAQDEDAYGESQYCLDAPNEMKAHIKNELGWKEADWQKQFPRGFVIPSNVYIYATLNTFDQASFPIDAAFKRRWAMHYVGIDYNEEIVEKLMLPKPYAHVRWLDFIKVINKKIVTFTKSDDKQIGQWFVKHDLSEARFKSKVLYYLWFDVFEQTPWDIFKDETRTYNDILECYDEGIFTDEIAAELKR